MAQTPPGPGGGTTYSYSQLQALWIQAGGSVALAPLMAAIAEAESSGDPAAQNPSGASGLWQIMCPANSQYVPGGCSNVFAAANNAAAAVAIYKAQGLDAWETFTNGAYKAFMSNSTSPDYSGLPGAANPSGSTTSTPNSTDDCLWGNIPGVPALWSGTCIITYGNMRALIGVGLLIGSLPIAFVALRMLASDVGVNAEKLATPVGAVLGPERQQQPKDHPVRKTAEHAAEAAVVAA
jgi:hypothetical protein